MGDKKRLDKGRGVKIKRSVNGYKIDINTINGQSEYGYRLATARGTNQNV